MSDKKISQLSSASTPLAGTEVLPIVQSSATVKVATNDLTVRNVRANATSGILQVTGPAAASTRVMTVPDANFTVARTDAANSFTGDQTLATGNLVPATAGKGVDFSANTGAAGMTSELLDWYEEGTWTPQSTANGLIDTVGRYTRVGDTVTAWYIFTVSGSAGGGNIIRMSGFPFAAGALGYWGSITFSTAQDSASAPWQWDRTPDLYQSNGATRPSHSNLDGKVFEGYFIYKV